MRRIALMLTTMVAISALAVSYAWAAQDCTYFSERDAFCLEKSASSTTANVGDEITYTITATALGTIANAITTYITDTLPAGVDFVSASGGQGECVYDPATHTVRCGPYGLSALTEGWETVSYTITVIAKEPGTITNTAVDSFGNQGSATVEVVSPPPMPTSKDQCKNRGYAAFGFADQGSCITYVNSLQK